jgi:hypothetical protein
MWLRSCVQGELDERVGKGRKRDRGRPSAQRRAMLPLPESKHLIPINLDISPEDKRNLFQSWNGVRSLFIFPLHSLVDTLLTLVSRIDSTSKTCVFLEVYL